MELTCLVTKCDLAGSTSEYKRDEIILASLKAGEQTVMNDVYTENCDAFCKYIMVTFKCSYQRAMDIYPESFSIMYFNIQRGRLAVPLRSTLKTYLCSVGRHLYYRRYLDRYSTGKADEVDQDQTMQVGATVDGALMMKERAGQLKSLLRQLGDPCKSLLEQVYYKDVSFVALSERYDTVEGTLRKRKFDCLKKLRALIKTNKIEL